MMYEILVCMPYKKQWSDTVWDALSRIEMEDTRKVIKLTRVDTRKLQGDELREHIESCLPKAHVILADLTEANPNVHIEIGFALARRMPLLLITQDRCWVTTHLLGWMVDEYSLDPESLAHFTTRMLLRIREKLDLVEAQQRRAASEVTYQVQCYSHRDAVGLERYFREAKTRIDILTTNLSFLLEPYSKQQPTGRTYFDEIRTALDRDGSKGSLKNNSTSSGLIVAYRDRGGLLLAAGNPRVASVYGIAGVMVRPTRYEHIGLDGAERIG